MGSLTMGTLVFGVMLYYTSTIGPIMNTYIDLLCENQDKNTVAKKWKFTAKQM